MTDLALFWDPATGLADIELLGADLATDDGLRTAVIISLFTDKRAPADHPLLDDGADRRGWFGDTFAEVDGDEIGSLLWLFKRQKLTIQVVAAFKEALEDALAWLVEDQVAASVDVVVERQGLSGIAFSIEIVRPTGPARLRFDYLWSNT